ncbi:MAG: PIN domain-containing protein [Vulcanimicrobiota bacterium]
MIALNASTLLAYLYGEPGSQVVATNLGHSCMSTVNLCEVLSHFTRDGHDGRLVLTRLLNSPIEFVGFSAADAAESAALLPVTRVPGLSSGDRACLARVRGIPALTADQVWLELGLDLDIRVIR